MIEGMRRVSLVSVMAAAVVIGHLGYHLVHRCSTQRVVAAVDLPPRPWAAGAPAPAPFVETADILSHTCRLQPPLSEADRAFIERFQTCGVDVLEFHDDVLLATAFGRDLTGARFRKTPHGWIALASDVR